MGKKLETACLQFLEGGKLTRTLVHPAELGNLDNWSLFVMLEIRQGGAGDLERLSVWMLR